eukprot:gnl/MRDRNA2_/MRDRNA2_65027_c0_seq2.p1 gnl/MRDRNA2_/MRDRNA2_65027_c0~~gnl/MRDRNA2_/MRDRNA2_65027_c0_seq2.p1  ORF type:complete len:407 (-),score=73.96 gnl/MRDRNA2_/MRDRNA2_65027_c0_seq2:195-1322(-)
MSGLLLTLLIASSSSFASGRRIQKRNRAHSLDTRLGSEELHITPWADLHGGFGSTEEQRAWFTDQPSYKAIYPEFCDGRNFNDEKLESLNGGSVDGWSCIHKPIGGMGIGAVFKAAMDQRKARTSSIISLSRWAGQRYICCAGHCRKRSDCGKPPLNIQEATKALVDSVADMQTKSGKGFLVNTVEEPKEEGVLATAEFRFDSQSLEFESEESNALTVQGRQFLDELAGPLSLHISMLLTSVQEQRSVKNESLRVLFCAHGTLESSQEEDEALVDKFKARADVLAEHLKELASKVPDETQPTVGTSHGHLHAEPHSDPFPSVSLIYKIYEPSLFKAECKTADLYAFLPAFNPTPSEDISAYGQLVAQPPSCIQQR